MLDAHALSLLLESIEGSMQASDHVLTNLCAARASSSGPRLATTRKLYGVEIAARQRQIHDLEEIVRRLKAAGVSPVEKEQH